MEGVTLWMGCSHAQDVPAPMLPGPHLSHPGGCFPSEIKQALGWASMRGDAEIHSAFLSPLPAIAHLHISVHDAQVVEVHWGQDGAVRDWVSPPYTMPIATLRGG